MRTLTPIHLGRAPDKGEARPLGPHMTHADLLLKRCIETYLFLAQAECDGGGYRRKRLPE